MGLELRIFKHGSCRAGSAGEGMDGCEGHFVQTRQLTTPDLNQGAAQ